MKKEPKLRGLDVEEEEGGLQSDGLTQGTRAVLTAAWLENHSRPAKGLRNLALFPHIRLQHEDAQEVRVQSRFAASSSVDIRTVAPGVSLLGPRVRRPRLQLDVDRVDLFDDKR